MSTKQPKRNNKETSSTPSTSSKTESQSSETKSVEDIDDWLDNIDTDQADSSSKTVSRTNTIEEEETKVSVDELLAEFVRQLPQWVNKPWMYVKPTHDGHLQSWYQSWRDLILKYSKVFTKHIISVYDLREVHPFHHQSSGKSLSLEQVQYIIDEMIDENLAKWLDNDRARARIYFTTDAEWADIIYDYMVDTGYVLDIMTFYELQNLDQDWSTLPDEELRIVLDLLVDENKAEWVGTERDTIQFKLQ